MTKNGRSLAPLPADGDGLAATAGMSLFVVADQVTEPFLASLFEHPVDSLAARLCGFEQFTLPGIDWHVVRPAEHGHVDGRLYRSLAPEDFRRLDAYCGVAEGLYRRLPVTVEVMADDGAVEETALTYLPTEKTLRRYR
jgi:hypothetical protein